MAAVVVAITHKHTFRFKEQSILTSRTGFAYHAFIIVFFSLLECSRGVYPSYKHLKTKELVNLCDFVNHIVMYVPSPQGDIDTKLLSYRRDIRLTQWHDRRHHRVIVRFHCVKKTLPEDSDGKIGPFRVYASGYDHYHWVIKHPRNLRTFFSLSADIIMLLHKLSVV